MPTPVTQKGGVALTFDDYSIDNWHTYLPLFDSLNIKCTFYVSNYNKLTAAQKTKLHDIQNHGHEIAFHSTNHVDFVKTLQSTGLKKLLHNEVDYGMNLLHQDGFNCTTFAYPYGVHNLIMDKALLKKFKSVRILNGTHDLNNSLCNLSGNTVVRGLGIDETSSRSLNHICDLLTSAADQNKCAVLLIHNIERKDINMQLPLWKLKNLLVKAKSLHLRFYTVSEISGN